MSIWNPFAFGPTGQPMAPMSPPALRVLGGVATALQLAYAKDAFHRFSALARVSTVPNPTEQGYLPDGSRYQIVVVGPQATMTVWVADSEDLRLSGIGLALVNLDGSLLEGHSKDGFPIGYLLTPHVKRGTRISNGRWTVRKPPRLLGGKAVNASADGKTYFAGIDGRSDNSVPLPRRQTDSGVNALAYDDDLYEDISAVYTNTRPVAMTRGAPLPFFYKKGTVRHAMQIIVRNEEFPAPYFVDLFVGPAKTEVTSVIGELVDTVELPSGQSLDYRSLTFKGDGTQARATGRVDQDFACYDISISPEGLSITIARRFPPGNTTSTNYWNTFKSEVSPGWGELEPGSTFEVWEIHGTANPPVDTPYGATFSEAYNGEFPIDAPVFGNATYKLFSAGAYRFNRLGEPDNELRVSRASTGSGYGETYSKTTVVPYIDEDGREQKAFASTSEMKASAQNFQNGQLRFSFSDGYTWQTDGRGTTTVSGSGFESQGQSGKSTIYRDDDLEFEIYYNDRQYIRGSWDWVVVGGGGLPVRQYNETEYQSSTEIKVICKGKTHLSKSVDFSDNYRYQFFVASDPMTGALVVNLQDVHSGTRIPRASWIYVVDSTGARELHEIMDVPANQNIRVLRNASLISV
ncbi:MAG: hypothetical protein ACK4OE_04490 [Acidovorax sp.]|uniref:hypothetical protein n=1 Tax=Acidovorax sp. TaxID=1872122 RepID=UPI00391889EF